MDAIDDGHTDYSPWLCDKLEHLVESSKWIDPPFLLPDFNPTAV